MRSMSVFLTAGAALIFGLVPTRAMPVTSVASHVDVKRVIPIGGGCGPGAYRVGGVCRAPSGPVTYRYQNGARTSNSAGCIVYRPHGVGQLLRFCR